MECLCHRLDCIYAAVAACHIRQVDHDDVVIFDRRDISEDITVFQELQLLIEATLPVISFVFGV